MYFFPKCEPLSGELYLFSCAWILLQAVSAFSYRLCSQVLWESLTLAQAKCWALKFKVQSSFHVFYVSIKFLRKSCFLVIVNISSIPVMLKISVPNSVSYYFATKSLIPHFPKCVPRISMRYSNTFYSRKGFCWQIICEMLYIMLPS